MRLSGGAANLQSPQTTTFKILISTVSAVFSSSAHNSSCRRRRPFTLVNGFELTAKVLLYCKLKKVACSHYVNGKSLSEVREIMATDHNFQASYVGLPSHPLDG